jgi:hypothetical protein
MSREFNKVRFLRILIKIRLNITFEDQLDIKFVRNIIQPIYKIGVCALACKKYILF